MPRLATPEFFNPDLLQHSIVGMAGVLRDHDSTVHQHRMGQLLYSMRGCVRLTLGNPQLFCLLPPNRAAWIPAGTAHQTYIVRPVEYRSVWFDPSAFPTLPKRAGIVAANPLLTALLERAVHAPFDTDWTSSNWCNLAALTASEIAQADAEPMLLALPSDRRLLPLMQRLSTLPPPLDALALEVGASVRTIGRIFHRETGLSYQQWRQQWRLMRAVELLASGVRQHQVSSELGFASDSAFIAFFKTMTGCTTRQYLNKNSRVT